MRVRAKHLAYWYLRLNGFRAITDFIFLPEQRPNQVTDVDVLAVRFPDRPELNVVTDDEPFTGVKHRSFIALTEVKADACALDGPWTHPSGRNIHKVLRALGAFPPVENELAAVALSGHGAYESQHHYVSFVCLGKEENPEVAKNYPKVPQITWFKALSFIYNRFASNRRNGPPAQWDEQGRLLWETSAISRNAEEFAERVAVTG